MPAYLSDAARSYNQIKRIHPQDSIAQLAYYQTSVSSPASRDSSPRAAIRKKMTTGHGAGAIDGVPEHQLGEASSQRRAELPTYTNPSQQRICSSSTDSSYSSRLVNLILRRHEVDDSSASNTNSIDIESQNEYSLGKAVHDRLTSSGRSILKNIQSQVSKRLRGSIEEKLNIDTGNQQQPPHRPFESSGFSEETLAGTAEFNGGSVRLFEGMRRGHKPARADSLNWHSAMPDVQSKNLKQFGVANANTGLPQVRFNLHSDRTRRRKLNRINKRMLVTSTDAYGNPVLLESSPYDTSPYALSEMFSQSEIPGFREIFASDSYLRKFCWVIAFLGMTIWSLHDTMTLVSDYVTHPVTVDVRLVDTARLPFPAVTVCNLNVVRYSGLCSSHLELASQIPSELRDKLCGIQVDKKRNSTEQQKSPASDLARPQATGPTPMPATVSDMSDINNVGLVATTSHAAAHSSSASAPESSQDSSKMSSTSLAPPAPVSWRADSSLQLGSNFSPSARASKEESKLALKRNNKKRSIIMNPDSGHPFGPRIGQQQVTSTTQATSSTRPRKVAAEFSAAPISQLASSVQTSRVGPAFGGRPNNYQPAIGTTQAPPGFASGSSSPISSMLVPFSVPQGATSSNSATTFSPPSGEEFELTERQERELQENLTNWLAVMHQLNPKLTRSMGHQFDDMMLRCTMKSINCTRESAFEKTFTPTEGNCFTYRSRGRRRNGERLGYEEANLAGTNDGLELVLNLEKSEYITGSSQVGALVMVHYPDELGYAASEATLIAPEFTTYIGLKMVNITRLPDPYPEHCIDSWPAQMRDSSSTTRNATYSQQTCLKMCLQKTIQAHCACQSAFLPPVDAPIEVKVAQTQTGDGGLNGTEHQETREKPRVIICDTRKRQTRQCVRDVNLRAADRVGDCECPAKCHSFRYDKTISVARWPTDRDRVSFDRGKTDVNFQNLAKVIVYFQTMTREEVTQQAVYTAAKFTSSIGGIMGMYVGFSFLSLFEIVEVMSRKLWHYTRMRLSSSNWLPSTQ